MRDGLPEGGRIPQYFYSQAGEKKGPVSIEELRRMAAAGEVLVSDLVWTEGMDKWQRLSDVAGIIAMAQPVTQPVAGPLQYAAPMNLGPSYQGLAICAFVCSLLLPPVGLVVGWVALAKMRRTANRRGRGLAVAGLVLGIIGSVCLGLILMVAVLCFTIR